VRLAALPARQPLTDLPESPALSMLERRSPGTFAGRKLGVLITPGADASVLTALRSGAAAENATVEIIAPVAGGTQTSDGSPLPGKQVDGAPSVLFDTVAVVATPDGARELAANPAARDFVSDAYAHCKLIGYTDGAAPLLETAGIRLTGNGGPDDGSSAWPHIRQRISSAAAANCATGNASTPRSPDSTGA